MNPKTARNQPIILKTALNQPINTEQPKTHH